ncbi:flagellar hook-length control protein FliK [Alteromonas portus]|uniref:Flagellar hook-length control protein FliK n=1 Tax=Alteromonas portus TaxID=2565549 RepID=A0A4U0ZJC6_9ALTE|nr:flagellar hook-length control protein FliK [Alteromonas portus]TKB04827.1 flagellar hook-length control protein FliK [Alteromonas portus]
MTTPLSSLLAAALNQSTGSTSPTSLSSPGNVDTATQGTSRSTSPAIANAALSQAATLDNTAKVIVERLPERVLSITVTPNKVSSAAQVLNVVLPAEVSAKLSNQAINNAQLALLPASPSQFSGPEAKNAQNASQSQLSAQSAILLSTSLSQQGVALSAPDKAELLKAVTQALAANNAAVTLKGQLSISTRSENFGQLMLTTAKNEVVPLTDINTEKLDSTAKAALQKLVGQQVVIGLSRASNGGIALQISQGLSNESAALGANHNNSAAITHKNVSTNLQQQLISSALKQGGVAVERNLSNPPQLNALLKGSGADTSALKVLSALTLTDSKLSIRTVQQSALLQIDVPQSKALSLSAPTLTQEHVSKLNLSQLPKVTAKGLDAVTGNSSLEASSSITNLKAVAPTSLKGTDVHNAITALSRVLLSQTGNTNLALSQLIAIVENEKLSPSQGISKAHEAQHFEKILQHLKGIDALNAKPSQIKVSNGEFIGPPKPSSEQLLATAKAIFTEGKDAASAESNSMQGKDGGSKSSLVSLASLAQTLSSKAKGLSNSLLSNIAAQLAATKSKGEEIAPVVSDSHTTIAGSKTKESVPGENESAIEGVKSGTKKLALDMNEQGLSQRLQQLISSQALVTTPINLTSPVNASSFVQGLVALVQLALAGRAMQRQPGLKTQIDAPDSIVSKTLANMGVTTQPSRVSQDMNQLDSRQQLLSQLKTLLSSHQQNKIANVDSRIQGQDSFYYVLPSLSQHQSPPELLIKREQGGQNNKHAQAGQRSLWNITMKLDIGDSGQVLAKSKIDKSTITLDLYASNDEVLRRIGDTLPYLHKRLTSLGLVVENTSYQRGHIPDTLNSRPHQIFETRV